MKMSVGIVFVFVAVCSLQLTSEAAPPSTMNPNIVFPGPIQDIENRYGTVNETDPCEGLTYCTIKPDNYPQERYNKMYKGKVTEKIFQPIPDLLGERQGDPDVINNCESTIKFEPLYKVKGQNGEWRTVVQAAKENYLQMVRLEICDLPKEPCFTSFKAPPNIRTSCKQGYNTWEFLVDDEKGGTERIQVELPVCCSCHYTRS